MEVTALRRPFSTGKGAEGFVHIRSRSAKGAGE
jgi:hypothetical protein